MAAGSPLIVLLDAQREELEKVLSSGLFERNSNLGRLLEYLCRKLFEGVADEVKEYNIALDVFGRQADFDKRRDSIVRVEASRLRKKLKEYYDGEARTHALQIALPPGQYVPRFVTQGEAPGPAQAPEVSPEPRAKTFRLVFISVAAVILVLSVIAAFQLARPRSVARDPEASRGVAQAASEPSVAATAVPGGGEVRILCGYQKEKYTDRYGRVWYGDRYAKGGGSLDVDREPIARTLDARLFHAMRTGSSFGYDIPLKPGVYELRLYFAETSSGPLIVDAENRRLMNVRANGTRLLDHYDVFASAAGGRTGDVQVFRDIRPADDGYLHLSFTTVVGVSFVNAIEIIPAEPGKMLPIRIAARETAYTDTTGRVWQPDNYFLGGRLVAHTERNVAHPDGDLFTSERYGHFTYAVPVPQGGRYAVRLRFAETYFCGKDCGDTHARRFNVYCNGTTLLRDFDIAKEAGAAYKPVDRVFRGVEPNALGKIFLTFEPVTNYAMVNAIEVTEQ